MAEQPAEQYGVSNTLAGYVVESENITTSPQREQVHNHQNAVTAEIEYDIRYELKLTVRGASEPAATTLSYASQTWIVDSVEKAGSYNGLRRFNITAHRYTNCNSVTSAQPSGNGQAALSHSAALSQSASGDGQAALGQ